MSPTHQRYHKIQSVLNKRQRDLSVVLENVHDPHNISAVLRSCDAVGVQDVYILNTHIPLPEKLSKRSSSSALKWLSIHLYSDINTCVQALRKKHATLLCTHLEPPTHCIYETDWTQNSALILGNEHSGVSPELRALCDRSIQIPQAGMIQSLNISVACAVILYEAFRARKNKGHFQGLTPSVYQNLRQQWAANHGATKTPCTE